MWITGLCYRTKIKTFTTTPREPPENGGKRDKRGKRGKRDRRDRCVGDRRQGAGRATTRVAPTRLIPKGGGFRHLCSTLKNVGFPYQTGLIISQWRVGGEATWQQPTPHFSLFRAYIFFSKSAFLLWNSASVSTPCWRSSSSCANKSAALRTGRPGLASAGARSSFSLALIMAVLYWMGRPMCVNLFTPNSLAVRISISP